MEIRGGWNFWKEQVSLVENGIWDAETVNMVIKAAIGRRLTVFGLLENTDIVGADVTLAIDKTVLPSIDSRPGPVALSGKTGGRGQTRFQMRRGLLEMAGRRAGRAAGEGGATLEKGAR